MFCAVSALIYVINTSVRTCAIAAVGYMPNLITEITTFFFFYLYPQLQMQLSDAVVSGAILSPVIKGT